MSAESSAGRYHIGTVSKLTGLSIHTIRVWERRYGAVEPERSPGGTREYSDEHVDKLILLQTLSDGGHAIGRIAGLDVEELRAMLASARRRGLVSSRATSRESILVAGMLADLRNLDIASMERSLLEAASILSPLSLVFDVVAPLVEGIGAGWESGDLRIASEHAASAVLRTLLGRFIGKQVTASDAPMAVAATLTGEQHELGALMAAFVVITRGWRVMYMGPNLPGAEISHVIGKTSARLLLLSIVNQRSEDSAGHYRELGQTLPSGVQILVGGRSASEYADVFGPLQRVQSLQDLHERLAPGRSAD